MRYLFLALSSTSFFIFTPYAMAMQEGAAASEHYHNSDAYRTLLSKGADPLEIDQFIAEMRAQGLNDDIAHLQGWLDNLSITSEDEPVLVEEREEGEADTPDITYPSFPSS